MPTTPSKPQVASRATPRTTPRATTPSTERPSTESSAERTPQGLAGALGWIAQGRHSGTLKLRPAAEPKPSDDGPTPPGELAFVDGSLFVRPDVEAEHRLTSTVTSEDPPTEDSDAEVCRVARMLAQAVVGLEPGNFRFATIDPDAWWGPVSTQRLRIELLTVDATPEVLLDTLDGEDTPWIAGRPADPELPLERDEALILSRLGTAATLGRVCDDLGENPELWLVAMARLQAGGLLRSPTDSELQRMEREAGPSNRGTADPEPIPTPEDPPSGDPLAEDALSDDDFLSGRSAPDLHPAALAIWRDQFQLTSDPFTLTPDPAFLYLSPGHAEALAGLKLGIWERRGLMVMIGEVGTGKTTLVYSLLSNLDPEIETAYLSNTLLSFEEILASALRDFGIECASRQRIDLIEALNAFLRRCAVEGKTVVLVIDEAQNLSDEVFEGLRLLLNFETYKSKLLQIVLVGQPELATRLSGPGLRQVRDRVAVRCDLNPLSRREALGYIEHRLDMVGGTPSLFTRPALGLLIRKSKGIPRRINVLCHNALLFAFGRDQLRVNRALAAQAIRDIEGGGLRHG